MKNLGDLDATCKKSRRNSKTFFFWSAILKIMAARIKFLKKKLRQIRSHIILVLCAKNPVKIRFRLGGVGKRTHTHRQTDR